MELLHDQQEAHHAGRTALLDTIRYKEAAAIGQLNFKLAGHDKIVDKTKRQGSSRDNDQGLVDVL